jgi:hypothetical protein
LIRAASEGLSASAIATRIYEAAQEFGTVTDDTVVFSIGTGLGTV